MTSSEVLVTFFCTFCKNRSFLGSGLYIDAIHVFSSKFYEELEKRFFYTKFCLKSADFAHFAIFHTNSYILGKMAKKG